MTPKTPTAEQLAAECKRLVREYGEALVQRGNFPERAAIHNAIDKLAAMAKAAEGANSSAQQSGEAEVVSVAALEKTGRAMVRRVSDSVTLREGDVLYTRPQQVALTDAQWYDLARRNVKNDWDSRTPGGYLNAVKALCNDFNGIGGAR